MNTSTITLIVVVFAVWGLIMYIVSVRNGIVRNKNGFKRAWATVIAWQRKKNNVIPELEKGMKKYGEFESATHVKLTELRASLGKLSEEKIDQKELQEVEGMTKELITGLKATFEAYANLKTSDLYLRWMKELSEIEDNVAAAITVFNSSVQEFNNSIQEFPGNLINSLFNNETAVKEFTDSKAQEGFEYSPNT